MAPSGAIFIGEKRMSVTIFMDESGDLGWEFDYPFQHGGSSRYFTLTAVIVPNVKIPFVERITAGMYKRRSRSYRNELKSSHLSPAERLQVAQSMVELVGRHRDIEIRAITVQKENVIEPFRRHPNGLYNYMTKLLLLEEMAKCGEVAFIPDARSIKVELKHSLDDYLKTELAAGGAETRLVTTPWQSDQSKALQMVDYLCSIVWSNYEFKTSKALPTLLPALHHKFLFFSR